MDTRKTPNGLSKAWPMLFYRGDQLFSCRPTIPCIWPNRLLYMHVRCEWVLSGASWPGGGGGERGEAHGAAGVVPQGIRDEGLPPLRQLHIRWTYPERWQAFNSKYRLIAGSRLKWYKQASNNYWQAATRWRHNTITSERKMKPRTVRLPFTRSKNSKKWQAFVFFLTSAISSKNTRCGWIL